MKGYWGMAKSKGDLNQKENEQNPLGGHWGAWPQTLKKMKTHLNLKSKRVL